MGKRIAILLPDLRGGGAERMHLPLAAEWSRHGFEVTFVVLRARGELLPLLPPGVRVRELKAAQFRGALHPLIRWLRAERPHVLLAAMWPLTVIAVIAARIARTQTRVVVSDHTLLSRGYAGYGVAHRALLRTSLACVYPFADVRIGVSQGVAEDLAELSGLSRERFEVVPNPAEIVAAHEPVPPELTRVRGPLIISVGTLKKVKNHALLIEAFARINASFNATLCILGEGGERAALERLIGARGLDDRVLLPGFRADPGAYYRRADLFVLSSDYEGFGNVLVEALAHGVPVVSTDCPGGPREVLDHGRHGTLVPCNDPDALAAAMTRALQVPHDRAALRARAAEFSVERVALRYLELLCPMERAA
jgi:glycosyltransferase involved in cell wall biosynthesis